MERARGLLKPVQRVLRHPVVDAATQIGEMGVSLELLGHPDVRVAGLGLGLFLHGSLRPIIPIMRDVLSESLGGEK